MGDRKEENFNETDLKRVLLNFERKYEENQKLRIKHADSPTKFASSETELYAVLDEIQAVATQPELYPILVQKKTITTLLSLISHDNTDISAKVIGMIQELTDIDESNDQEPTEMLIDAMIRENLIELIVSNLKRLDKASKDDSQTIINSLGVIDNLIDFDSKSTTISSKPLIHWMVSIFKNDTTFNSIKLSVSELLSELLMSSQESKIHLHDANGIDALLQQVAYYRLKAPETGDEHEFLEQTINCLCTAILNCELNRESFFQEEGVDLVELILREKRDAIKKSNLKVSTLKLFNYVLTSDENQDAIVTKCCERFIDILGLRVIFPLFNNPKLVLNEKVKRREYRQFLDDVEENTSAIILALIKNSQNTEHIQRILVKFAEINFEKFERLLNLHDKYFKIVRITQENDDSDRQNIDSSRAFFTLRTIDYAILLVSYLSNQFETYDPASGVTFSNYLSRTIADRPQLRHQILLEARKHVNEVADSKEESESIQLLIDHFDGLGKQYDKKGSLTVKQ